MCVADNRGAHFFPNSTQKPLLISGGANRTTHQKASPVYRGGGERSEPEGSRVGSTVANDPSVSLTADSSPYGKGSLKKTGA